MPRLKHLDEVGFEVACGLDPKPVSARLNSVLSGEHRLASQQEALNLATVFAQQAFPESCLSEWSPARMDACSAGATFFIDMVNQSSALDFSAEPEAEKPDAYSPFVRVTYHHSHGHSRDGSRSFIFDIGYMRKACKNALISPAFPTLLKLHNPPRTGGRSINFDIDHRKLVADREAFQGFLAQLQAFTLPTEAMGRLTCAVLGFRPPLDAWERSAAHLLAWCELVDTVGDTSTHYAQELGENANAALNVITGIATRPPANLRVTRDRHGFQRRAGSWLSQFITECSKPNFSLSAHIAALEKAGSMEPSPP